MGRVVYQKQEGRLQSPRVILEIQFANGFGSSGDKIVDKETIFPYTRCKGNQAMPVPAKNGFAIIRDLFRLESALHRNGDRITAEYGLNQQQFVVLSEIVDRGPISQKRLVGELVIEKSNLSKIVKKLKVLGLIDITPSSEDGRATLLSITPRGKSVWQECMEKFDAWQSRWVAPLSEEEVSQALRVLERLKALPL